MRSQNDNETSRIRISQPDKELRRVTPRSYAICQVVEVDYSHFLGFQVCVVDRLLAINVSHLRPKMKVALLLGAGWSLIS